MGFLSPIFGKGKHLSWLGKEKEKEREPSSVQGVAGEVLASASAAKFDGPEISAASKTLLATSSMKPAVLMQDFPLCRPSSGLVPMQTLAANAVDSEIDKLAPGDLVMNDELHISQKHLLVSSTQMDAGPQDHSSHYSSVAIQNPAHQHSSVLQLCPVDPPTQLDAQPPHHSPEASPQQELQASSDKVKPESPRREGLLGEGRSSPSSSTGVKVDSRTCDLYQAESGAQQEGLYSPSGSSNRISEGNKGMMSQHASGMRGIASVPLQAETSGSMAGSEDAASFGGASGEASGVQSGSAWGLGETARSTVSLPVTALLRRAQGRGKSKGSLLYDEVSVQEAEEEGEEDEDDAFSTGQVLDFWAGKRMGIPARGRDAMTDAGTAELRRAVSSMGRRGDSSMSPLSTSQCHQEQVHPFEHDSDCWDRTSSQHQLQHFQRRLPRAVSADSQGQHQAATVWETMTGHLESMRQKQQLQQQGQDNWEAGDVPGGNISPRTEPAPNAQDISGGGILDEGGLNNAEGPRGPCPWETEEDGRGSGHPMTALDVLKDRLSRGQERQDAASCADIETPLHAEAEFGESDRDSGAGDDDNRDAPEDDAASGGKLSAMTGMSDTALLHLLLQQDNREVEEDEPSCDGDASSDDALSHVPLRNGHIAVSISGTNLRKSATSTTKAPPAHDDALALFKEEHAHSQVLCGDEAPRRWAGIFDDLADKEGEEDKVYDELGYGDAEARLREMLGATEYDECMVQDKHQIDEEGETEEEDEKGAAGAGELAAAEYKLSALQASAAEWMNSGDVQKKAAQAQALMALRPDMARVAQWLTAVEPMEAPPDHIWFNTSDALDDPLVKDKQKPAPPPRVSSHMHKKPPVAGPPGHSGASVTPQLAGAMEAAARLLASKDKHLQALYLSAHGLQVVPPSLPAFSHLKTLDLSRNSIANVPPGLLPPSLHILDLSHNRLVAVEGLRDLGRLRLLNLSHNRITRIGHGLVGCSSLRELYLSSNKIGEVEGLHRLLKLHVLDLSSNKVTSTRAVSQLAANEGSLKALNLLSNPIHVNLGNDAFKRFVTGLLPHLQVLNQRSVKATGSSRDLIADNHTSSKGISRSGHHSRNSSSRDLRGKSSTSLSRRHGPSAGASSTAGSSIRNTKSGAHGVGSSKSRHQHHKSKESSRISGTRLHGSRLQPVVIPPGMDEQTFQQMLLQQKYLLLQQQMALAGQGVLRNVPVVHPGEVPGISVVAFDQVALLQDGVI